MLDLVESIYLKESYNLDYILEVTVAEQRVFD